MKDLTNFVREADEEVSKGYNGQNVSVYASAFAIARFCISLCKGTINDERKITRKDKVYDDNN